MSIVLDRLNKRYGDQHVVNNVSLEVADGELFVLLGASGSGKSTILRLIAGLTLPDSGRILLHGRDVTHLAPQPRGTGFVFQNYSIFRHMSVAANIEFGLKLRKVPPVERTRRGEELLEMVGLSGLGDRYPDQLSGGQQQRVALARALAYEPSVLLLDEPLGALDVKIRAQLRRSLKEVQRRLGVTTILVTHDQEEAFELGDRIGVLERGVLLEVGEAEDLYARPRSFFVARFLGTGTVLVGRAELGQARLGPLTLPIPAGLPHQEAAPIVLLVRPEQVELTAEEPQGRPTLGQGAVIEQTFSGALRRLRLCLPRLPGVRQISPPTPFGEECLLVDATVPAESPLPGRQLWVSLRGWSILEQPRAQLLVLDSGAGSTAALSLAALLAGRMKATVTALGLSADAATDDDLGTLVRSRIDKIGLAHTDLHLRTGRLTEQIAAQCAGSHFDLIVLPASPESEKRSTLPQEIIDLLERADLPVLIVKGETAAIERILICTRIGEPGKSGVRAGGRLAGQLGATATLLHVTSGSGDRTARARAHLEKAATTLKSLDVSSEIRIRHNTHLVEGILQEAQPKDLLVLGGHGPQSRSVFAADDITVRVLARSRQPVLVVPAEES